MTLTSTIPEIVVMILESSRYWAPEVKASKLCVYLEAFGDPLYYALLALSPEERESCGIDGVKRRPAP